MMRITIISAILFLLVNGFIFWVVRVESYYNKCIEANGVYVQGQGFHVCLKKESVIEVE